jgi:tRNA dimethylallyltransferase
MTPADQVRIIRALEVFFQSGKPLSEWQREHAFKDRPYRTLSLGLQPPREQLYERIDERTEIMMNEGLVEETRSLLGRGYAPDLKAMQTLGYRECQDFIRGEASYEQTVERIQLQTRRYAKRQMTWFRKYPINWFESSQGFGSIVELIDAFTMK